MAPSAIIHFDVLLRGSQDGASRLRYAREFRPRAHDIETSRAWLAARGVRCEVTSFGLACATPRENFLALFGSLIEPAPPAELRPLVAQVTLMPSPASF